VNAIKEGAYDYLVKPIHLEDIRIKVERALSTRKTEKSLKSMTCLLWCVIHSILIWLILGIALGFVWKWEWGDSPRLFQHLRQKPSMSLT
jgi:hypothetical protein